MVDTWCRLKAIAGQSGVIQGWQKQFADTKPLDISLTVLYRRLNALKAEGWLDYYNDRIIMLSWAEMHRRLGLRYDRNFFTHKTDTRTKHRFYWIYLAEALDNRARQAYMIAKKVNKNHSVKATVYNELVKDSTVDIAQCESNPAYLCELLQKMYITGFIKGGSEIYGLLTAIRPFTSRSVTGMGKAYNDDIAPTNKLDPRTKCRYAMNGLYVKKAMAKAVIAQWIPQRHIVSEVRERNPYAQAKWNRYSFITFHAFCDELEQVQPFTGGFDGIGHNGLKNFTIDCQNV